jgi:hypothetical protein
MMYSVRWFQGQDVRIFIWILLPYRKNYGQGINCLKTLCTPPNVVIRASLIFGAFQSPDFARIGGDINRAVRPQNKRAYTL